MDLETYALSKSYTNKSLDGVGYVRGKNCEIQSIDSITGGHRITFKWTGESGTVYTNTMDVMDGADGERGERGERGAQGIPGQDGLGIKSVDINAQNHLIITYDDDTTHDAGEIEGGGGTANVDPFTSAQVATILGYLDV